MARANSRKKHTFAVTVSFDMQLNEREALEAAKDFLTGFGGYARFTVKRQRGQRVDGETGANITSVRRASVG